MATKQSSAAPGVIDTIADGLSTALAYPWLMAVPLFLDAYYWLGWRLVPAALTSPIKKWIDDKDSSNSDSTFKALDHLGRSDMLTIVAQFVPALLPGVDRSNVYELWTRPTIDLRHSWMVVIALVAIVIASALVFAAYYVPLADTVIGRTRDIKKLPEAILRAWVRLLGMLFLIVGLFALVLGPPAVLWGISEAAGIGLGAILLPLMIIVGVSMVVLLIFTPEAIVVAEVGPFKAMYYSVNVVRRNLWPTVGITVASMTITFGLGEIWQRLAGTPPGLLVAVIANAFFAGGLAMAGMMFFNHRLRLLPQPAQN